MSASLNNLLEFSNCTGISVKYANLHKIHPDLLGYAKPPFIYLDNLLKNQPRQHKCVLAEEIGHCLHPPVAKHIAYHGPTYRILNQWERDNLSILVAKDERQALQWATSILIPDRAFWDYVATGRHEWWEWMEHFDVADWFMRAKIGFMRVKHPFKWREIIKRNATG